MAAALADPLQLLRLSIQTSNPPKLSNGPTPTIPEPAISNATHLIFTHPSTIAFTLNTPTRFVTKRDSTAFDLRSVVFAWEHRNDGIPAYVSACQSLGDGKLVKNLGFLERTDLITWLEGATNESDFIQPLQQDENASQDDLNGRGASGVAGQSGSGAVVRPRPVINPRLAEIYSRERVVTDRNSILRGIKPTDFSHVRKISENYLKRMRTGKPDEPGLPDRPGAPARSNGIPKSPGTPGGKSRPQMPIILLSPSSSALLKMSNIKAFLENGTFAPPAISTAAGEGMLYINRLLPSINANQATRFIVVDSPDRFKPDYWGRVVAVFTTGQLWQFKSYKWSTPGDLFVNVKGFYLGWAEEPTPPAVASWGNVNVVTVEKGRRFRDREVMELFWDAMEKWMMKKGWGSGRPQA